VDHNECMRECERLTGRKADYCRAARLRLPELCWWDYASQRPTLLSIPERRGHTTRSLDLWWSSGRVRPRVSADTVQYGTVLLAGALS
jgi:hypothetical protein